jgi:hypothetical protein
MVISAAVEGLAKITGVTLLLASGIGLTEGSGDGESEGVGVALIDAILYTLVMFVTDGPGVTGEGLGVNSALADATDGVGVIFMSNAGSDIGLTILICFLLFSAIFLSTISFTIAEIYSLRV